MTVAMRRLEAAIGPGETYQPPAEKLLSGDARQTVWQQYADGSGKFFVGVWQGEVGKWKVQYTEEEYCQILQGISVITDSNGSASTVVAGDRFVLPRGFAGTWEVIEATRKLYVIYEPGT
jgi:hypothetical protein